jgi:acid phosphatase family membrane protein YuiD
MCGMREYLIHHISLFFQEFSQHRFPPIFVVAIVGVIIQTTKIIIDSMVQRRFSLDEIFTSGGFPSFHSGIVSSVTLVALLTDGVYSVTFAVAASFSLLFAYDAMNLRFQTGKHAEYLNDLRRNLQDTLSMKKSKHKLKENIGHTPLEVIGGVIFGIVLTFVLYYILYV